LSFFEVCAENFLLKTSPLSVEKISTFSVERPCLSSNSSGTPFHANGKKAPSLSQLLQRAKELIAEQGQLVLERERLSLRLRVRPQPPDRYEPNLKAFNFPK
jgi:hypothetical protein